MMLIVKQMDRKATVCAVVIFCDSHDLLLIQFTKVIAQHVFTLVQSINIIGAGNACKIIAAVIIKEI